MTRIDKLIADMTLEEKIGQLNMLAWGAALTGPMAAGDATDAVRLGRAGTLLNLIGAEAVEKIQRVAVEESRLGIPLLFGYDVIHGHRTIFPIPLGEAALFDPVRWESTAREAAVEAAEDGQDLTFAPMLDIARDPRWGRSSEGPGEDPWVTAQFAKAKVRGFQGTGLSDPASVAACVKHFCAYGAVTAGREYAATDISERTVHEVHLPAFESAMRAGAATLMPAFTDLAGVPMTIHEPLLRDWLRGRMGFNGVVISDYNAITELMHHGVAGDLVEAAALALKAGVDIDMMGNAYIGGLAEAIARGLVSLADLEASVRRVLALKEQLGLFDDPYRRCRTKVSRDTDRRKVARDVAGRAIVLLTNNSDVLPLSRHVQRIAVVGPLADAGPEMRGPWSAAGEPGNPVSILDGLRAALPDAKLGYAPGVAIESPDQSGIAAALDLCRASDVVLLCVGEAANMSGEAASRTDLDLPGCQRAFAEAVLDLGKPVVAILSSGRPLTVSWLAERATALLATWFLGSEAGSAIADVVTGRISPGGRLPVTWPRNLGQVPIFYAQRPSGRPADPKDHYTSKYRDSPVTPLFPFGHGLTYGRFALSNLRVSAASLAPGQSVDVTVDLINEGRAAAEETVFLFIRDLVASVARPVLELKDVQKIALAPGARGTVRFNLAAEALAFPGPDFEPRLEPGEFEILVGPRADRDSLLRTLMQMKAGEA